MDEYQSSCKKLILYQKLMLNTPLQTTAARINIKRDVTTFSIHNTRSRSMSENFLTTLLQQLPNSVILTGNFNGYLIIIGYVRY